MESAEPGHLPSEHFRAIVEGFSDGVMVVDSEGPDQPVVYVNAAVERMTGYSKDELLGRNARFLQGTDRNQPGALELAEAVRSGRSATVVLDNYRKDGSRFANRLALEPLREADGSVRFYMATLTDVTALHATRRALSQRDRMLEEAHVLGGFGHWWYDPAQRQFRWCASVFELFGRDPERGEPTPAQLAEAFEGPVGKEIEPALSRCGEAGEPLELRGYVEAGRGGRRFLVMRGYRSTDPRWGRPVVLGTVQDLTERRQSEDQLRRYAADLERARDEAQQSNQFKSQFLANMSHEIRTPMNAVVGLTAMLLETDLNSEQQDLLETIRSSGQALLTLVNDILDLSKAEAGRMELERLPYRPRDLVDAVVSVIKPLAENKGLAVRSTVDPDVPESVEGDANRIRQILLNLLSNGVKFTERGEVGLSLRARGRSLEFEVWDTGVGIPPRARERVFEPFTQVDATVTRTHGGTGLGLTICRKLVDLMAGQLEMQSQVGQGTTFRVRLPLARTRADGDETADTSVTGELKSGLRVLVVEDNPVNVKVVRLMLERLGIRPEVARDGAEGLEKLEENRFDVVLMDLHMPRVDGLTATRKLRERCSAEQPWVIALTASAFEENRRACQEAGFDDFLTKPIRLEDVHRALGRAQSRSSDLSVA
ncbi:MAG TPA: ATP-binding protein [Myxococcales bacterium LLY-WYZ-16_1]|nr:ATP-binding protein [Myxococcales bacterium LLY-WYZ-16_1]